MIDEFRVICFIFKDGVEFSWWFFSCFVRLFSALNRKVEGFLKLTDCLLILSCVLKRFIYLLDLIYFLRPFYPICLSRV